MTHVPLKLDAFVPYRLSFTAGLVSDAIARTYQSLFGLSIPEWRVIAWIADEPEGIAQRDICIRTRMDKLTVSRAAIALTARGLVERSPRAEDRRSHLLTLTAAGQVLYEAVAPKAIEMERRMLASIEPDELIQFVSVLRRIDAVALAFADDGEAPDIAGSTPGDI